MQKNNKKIKVLCGMSGGVDSSVAATILQKDGYEVIGIFMKFWSESGADNKEGLNKCCSVESYMSAKRVAQILDIPLYTINFQDLFKDKIVDNFLSEYQIGSTPNPCVRCNQFIKFGTLIDKAKDYGAEFVATGHYASKSKARGVGVQNFEPKKQGRFSLLKGKDSDKDQSYFLHRFTQDQLKHVLFPLSGYTKPEVRKLAEKFKLPTAHKAESQELCFINEKDHYNFLKRYLKLVGGDIVTIDGKKVGEHQGLPLYTIGQRRGIEIGGTGPYYVVEMDFEKNRLIVAKENSDLMSDGLVCDKIHWISGVEPKFPLNCKARVRYRQEESGVIVEFINDKYVVKFKEKQRAITIGQSCVFYKDKEVLGGGIISEIK